jgi:hypothetical protein
MNFCCLYLKNNVFILNYNYIFKEVTAEIMSTVEELKVDNVSSNKVNAI